MLKVNVWIRLLFSISAAWLAQWAFAKLGGMFAGLATQESGAPVSITHNLPAIATASSLALVFVTILFTAYFDRAPLNKIGLTIKNQEKWMVAGVCAAIFVLSLVSAILSVMDHVHFSTRSVNPSKMLILFLTMVIVAIGEETFFRGYIQRNLQQAVAPVPALLSSAFIFTFMHAGNPSQNMMALPGIFAGGVLLGINYLYTGNLWFSIALHATWNFVQGPVLGYAVSGIAMESIFQPNSTGPIWMTGGPFGVEASILTCLVNLLLAGFMILHFKRSATK